MRGCLQVLAVLVAIVFVITAVIAMLVVPLVRVVTDRDAIKTVLADLDDVVIDVVPSLVAQSIEEQARQQGFTQLDIDEAVMEEAIDALIPPEWLEAQTETAVDALYDMIETGDMENAEIEIDTRPLLDRMRGEPGKQVVATIVDSLPVCTEPINPEALLGGDVKIPTCIPPDVPRDELVAQVHTQFVQTLDEDPEIMAQAGVITVPIGQVTSESQIPEIQQAQAQLEQLNRYFLLAKRWSWTLWLIPVGCLFMILLLVVRSMSTFGYWWGWPLVITAVFVFIATFVLPTFLSALLGASILPTGGETVAVLAQDFVRGILDSVTDIWLNRVTMQAIVMFVVGLLLIGFGVLTRSQKSTIQQF